MKTVENQKVIKLVKAETNSENIYGIVNKECMYDAMKNLTYNEFKIYMYIITNQDGYEFALSTQDIANKTGANKRKIQESVNSLIDKGYLQCDSGNHYTFNEECVLKGHRGMSQKDTGVCPKRTQGVSKKDTEILQDNTLYYNIYHSLDENPSLTSSDTPANDTNNKEEDIVGERMTSVERLINNISDESYYSHFPDDRYDEIDGLPFN